MTVTNPRASPIFNVSTQFTRAAVVALVSVTVTATGAFSFSAARCPHCRTLVMAIPGPERTVEVREFTRQQQFGQARGRVVRCPTRRCQKQLEVIEHGAPHG